MWSMGVVLVGMLELLAAPLAFGQPWEMAQAAIAAGVVIGYRLSRNAETVQVVDWSQLAPRAPFELRRAA